MESLDRRAWLRLTGMASALGVGLAASRVTGQQATYGGTSDPKAHSGHLAGPVGRVSLEAFHPSVFLRTWNFADRPAAERDRYYRETPRPDGSLFREYQFVAVDREIEIAP